MSQQDTPSAVPGSKTLLTKRYGLFQGRWEMAAVKGAELLREYDSLKKARNKMIRSFVVSGGEYFIVDAKMQAVVGQVWALREELMR